MKNLILILLAGSIFISCSSDKSRIETERKKIE